ncbi:MAG TPA: glycosyltransferase [Blastocatellia bacterium]|nr:glycosyltransferase [Blastocatellia bacterium]HMV85717.1 glycosyltransferase [Blastocatellia bacterium]HMY70946.1 glycosyltransferase [Blastocatellia bacterium]HMZ16408.1 glycosyltransferase [Blastocatellia bacterium]HNG31530.1 glycosyltransferase [Blastocatellia bacterium]
MLSNSFNNRISVVIPTWRRSEQLSQVLELLLGCLPPPDEILVHVDAGDTETIPMLDSRFKQQVTWCQSSVRRGPGGGRNLLIQQARFPLVASFDDDSWPLDQGFFQTAVELMQKHPNAAVLSGEVTMRGEVAGEVADFVAEANCYESGACVLRRDAFLQTGMYLPLRYAYGMEEADVALQLLDAGWAILKTHKLRIYHDSDLNHHASPAINAAHITNTALLTFLRYPVLYWPLGLAQVANRIRFALRVGRHRGVLAGVLEIPDVIHRYWQARKPVRKATILRSRELARTNPAVTS